MGWAPSSGHHREAGSCSCCTECAPLRRLWFKKMPLQMSRRVLEFPATAQRRPTTAAASIRQVSHEPGSLLEAEPAYRSALSRLGASGRPGTAPGTASTSMPPSSRLDALLAARPGTAAAAATTTAAPVVGSRLDALLAGRPASGTATTRQSAEQSGPPSSRLGALLATRPTLSAPSAQEALPSTRLDQLLAARPLVRPATSASAASGPSAIGATSAGRDQPRMAPPPPPRGARPHSATAALSPVEEESASASRGAGQPLLAGAGNKPAVSPSRPATGGVYAPSGTSVVAAAAQTRPSAGSLPDPALQDRLRERIELAKVGLACWRARADGHPNRRLLGCPPSILCRHSLPRVRASGPHFRAAAPPPLSSPPALPSHLKEVRWELSSCLLGCLHAVPDTAAAEPHVPPV